MAPNFDMKHWDTGKPMTFLEALGFSKAKFTFPQLQPALPAASAANQHPLDVQSSQYPAGSNSKNPPPKGPIQQYARKLMAQHGFTGAQEWGDFVKLVMSESGWNPHIKNPSSGAYGIAQALGHGNSNTQGTESNNYGGWGLTDQQARAANSGNAYWQLVWMMNYIKQKYGTPSAAWAFHVANNSY